MEALAATASRAATKFIEFSNINALVGRKRTDPPPRCANSSARDDECVNAPWRINRCSLRLADGLRRTAHSLHLPYDPLSTKRRQPSILVHVHPVLPRIAEASQLQLRRPGPDGQPNEKLTVRLRSPVRNFCAIPDDGVWRLD